MPDTGFEVIMESLSLHFIRMMCCSSARAVGSVANYGTDRIKKTDPMTKREWREKVDKTGEHIKRGVEANPIFGERSRRTKTGKRVQGNWCTNANATPENRRTRDVSHCA